MIDPSARPDGFKIEKVNLRVSPRGKYGAPVGDDDLVEAYLGLAVGLGRLLPGAVAVDAAARRRIPAAAGRPADLVRAAGRLAEDLAAAPLAPGRRRLLLAQVAAIECTARRLTGQHVPYLRELRSCYGLDVGYGEPDIYRAAHRALADLLPGTGPTAARMAAYRRADQVPADRLPAALAALAGALRARTRAAYGLPAGERLDLEVVPRAPWSALHSGVGPHHSVVTVNAGARPRTAALAHLVAHEGYPGHHTERCLRRSEHGEHAVTVVAAPMSVLSEGLAERALYTIVGPGWGPWAADVLAEVGVHLDGDLAERVAAAAAPLAAVRLDAALLLHVERAGEDAVRAHLRRWLLVDDARAERIVGFLRHPVWRGYTCTYVAGAALVGATLGPPGPGAVERHRRLLRDPVPPNGLRAVAPTGRRPDGDAPATVATTDGGGNTVNGRPLC